MNDLFDFDRKGLCEALVNSHSESEAISVLKKFNLWEDPNNWRLYGDRPNNFNTIGNQMESADSALVEKLTNSVDAILIREALKRGWDPEGQECPRTIRDAVREFFGVQDGVLSNLSARERTELAKQISLICSGSKRTPCYSIYDSGMGQPPSKFPETFLSLDAENKIKIPFVQGKFNMGSTGVLMFSGENGLQLILSKGHPDIGSSAEDASKWGFTIVRKLHPHGNMKTSQFCYLAPGNKILEFEADNLALLPGEKAEEYHKTKVQHGTFIKVYDYKIGASLRTNATLDLYNRLNLLLPSIPLPVRIWERRPGYQARSLETTMSGLTTRVEDDKRDNLESGFPTSSTFSVEGTEFKVDIFAFKKKDTGRSAKENYASREGVVFSINGQSQGSIDKTYFTSKRIGFGYLKDHLLVLVDCSQITPAQKEKMFMNNRTSLRQTDFTNAVREKLTAMLSDNKGLKALQQKLKQEAVTEKLKDDKPLADILESVLSKNEALRRILTPGARLLNPFNPTNRPAEDDFKGEEYPTYFTPDKHHSSNKPKRCEQGRAVRIQFNTDAENQYFSRQKNPGTLNIRCDRGNIDKSVNLWNGRATVTLELPPGLQVGEQLSLRWEVIDVSRALPFQGEFHVLIEEKKPRKPSNGGSRRPGVKPQKPGDDGKGLGNLAIPEVIPVSQDEWDTHEFDKFDALNAVYDSGSGSYDYFYNADNVYLQMEKKRCDDSQMQIVENQFKAALVLLGLCLAKDNDGSESDVGSLIKQSTRSVCPVLLPMIRELGSIEEIV